MQYYLFILQITFTAIMHISRAVADDSLHFVFVIPSYNNERWCVKNIESCVNQTYTNWSLIYINDASTDTTRQIVEQMIDSRGIRSRCTIINNQERKGALYNIYSAIQSLQPRDIVVLVDGDDYLTHQKVLARLASIYKDPRVWLTYGDFKTSSPAWSSCCRSIPKKVRTSNGFRSFPYVSSHLRTFYAQLFHNIKREDLLWNGAFLPMTGDMAIMLPMLEMSSKGHFRFIKKVLYIYNVENPLNDHRVNAELQRSLDAYIRAKPRYEPLEILFN